MKRLCTLLICASLLFCGCNISVTGNNKCGRAITIASNLDTSEIADLVSPAIVGINGLSGNESSVGSGVCVTNNGYILTNSHVVNGCKDVVLYLSDKTNCKAKIIYEDTVLDLAILKSEKNIPYLNLGNSDNLMVGEDVLAVGTPLSLTLTHTFTKGIVSALNRTLRVSSIDGDGYMQNLIQHDASLNPGNSGGPLINSNGEVVGINTLKISGGEGIGFAIPAKSFKSLLASFVENINYSTPYMGLFGLDSEIANFNKLTTVNEGFYIIDIAKNSPLKNMGIKVGDVITEIDGKKVKNTLDLRDIIYSHQKDDFVTIKYSRNGENYTIFTDLNKI